MTRWLYTTMRPDVLMEVDDAEFADLAAQGLIHAEADPPDHEAAEHVPHAAAPLDAAETLADDQPAKRPTSGG
jgi:hypothetical protein